jgi:hypothetical protein
MRASLIRLAILLALATPVLLVLASAAMAATWTDK